MATITVEYDGTKTPKSVAVALCDVIQDVIPQIIHLKKAIVYGHDLNLHAHIQPLEVLIEMDSEVMTSEPELFAELEYKLGAWKKAQGYSYTISMSIVPAHRGIATCI